MSTRRYYTPLLRKARRIAEGPNGDHRLRRFRLLPGSKESTLGPEWVATCRFCDQIVQVYPKLHALPIYWYACVSIAKCRHTQWRTTYFIRA
jgi:hypothetical protein